jgi:dTDP-4-dehydrorhamnose reductase
MLLLLGNGILGSALVEHCTKYGVKYIHATRKDLDLMWPIAKIDDALIKLIDKKGVNTIVNATGFTKVDLCEQEHHVALGINAYGPAKLANICSLLKFHFIHVSTDFVFNGKHTLNNPYIEEDGTAPINFYGYSKLLGESCIKESGCKYSIIRTGKLYNNTTGFIHKILNNMKETKRVYAVRHQYFSPTHAENLAKQLIKMSVDKLYGTYHATCWNYCSAYELIDFMMKKLNISLEVDEIPLFTHFSGAQRPEMCVLSTRKLQAFGSYVMDSWQGALSPVLQKVSVEWESQKQQKSGSSKT